MMVTFVLADDGQAKGNLARIDTDSVPMVEEIIEIKSLDYVVQSRRWKSGLLGPSVTVSLRAVLETTV